MLGHYQFCIDHLFGVIGMTLFEHACYDNKKSLTRRTETLHKEEPNMKIRIATLTALILIVALLPLPLRRRASSTDRC